MPPRIAIPVPTSFDPEYNDRSWPQYARAVERAGGEAVPIPLHDPPAATARLIASCTGVLLPGSGADVNPQKYGQPLHPAAAPPDPARENVDELLLQDAHNMGKPLLAICFGTQMLNVWRGGSLIQDIPSALPDNLVDHKPGRHVIEAHPIDIAPHSLLATLLHESANSPTPENPLVPPTPTTPNTATTPTTPNTATTPNEGRHSGAQLQNLRISPAREQNFVISTEGAAEVEKPASPTSHGAPAPTQSSFLTTTVNSSHHQAIAAPGDNLHIAARSTGDGVIEAIEGGHGHSEWDRFFLLGIQWHPERTYDESPLSRAIFTRFVTEAAAWTPRPVTTSVG